MLSCVLLNMLDMLDIFFVVLFRCAALLAYAPTIYVALKLGEIGMILLDLANRQ